MPVDFQNLKAKVAKHTNTGAEKYMTTFQQSTPPNVTGAKKEVKVDPVM